MTSAKAIVCLYMTAADSDPKEAKENLNELSRSTISSYSQSALIEGIQVRELKLLDFVKLLGEYLTEEESQTRKHGIYNFQRHVLM